MNDQQITGHAAHPVALPDTHAPDPVLPQCRDLRDSGANRNAGQSQPCQPAQTLCNRRQCREPKLRHGGKLVAQPIRAGNQNRPDPQPAQLIGQQENQRPGSGKNHAASGFHPPGLEQGLHRPRRHHTRQGPARKRHWPFHRTVRQHNVHRPQIARSMAVQPTDSPVAADLPHNMSGAEINAGGFAKRPDQVRTSGVGRPQCVHQAHGFRPSGKVRFEPAKNLPTGPRLHVQHDDAAASPRQCDRGCHSGRPGPHDNDIGIRGQTGHRGGLHLHVRHDPESLRPRPVARCTCRPRPRPDRPACCPDRQFRPDNQSNGRSCNMAVAAHR